MLAPALLNLFALAGQLGEVFLAAFVGGHGAGLVGLGGSDCRLLGIDFLLELQKLLLGRDVGLVQFKLILSIFKTFFPSYCAGFVFLDGIGDIHLHRLAAVVVWRISLEGIVGTIIPLNRCNFVFNLLPF